MKETKTMDEFINGLKTTPLEPLSDEVWSRIQTTITQKEAKTKKHPILHWFSHSNLSLGLSSVVAAVFVVVVAGNAYNVQNKRNHVHKFLHDLYIEEELEPSEQELDFI